MADEAKKEVEAKPDETKEKEVIKDTPEKIDTSKFVDKEAMAEIQKQNEAKFAELSNAKQKLDSVNKALTGESKEAQAEKFFKDFAEDPQGTLEKYYRERASKEIEPIKKQLRDREIAERDNAAFARLQQKDPEYANVMKNFKNYVTQEEFNSLENNPNRTDIIYSLIKVRMGMEEGAKKVEEKQATKQAKDTENLKAVSETPSGGKIEQETDAQRRRKEIDEGIAEGKWNDEELRKKSFDEYWELTQKK